jgi:deoxyribodipyrimidine photolyase-like uncharacterized protein
MPNDKMNSLRNHKLPDFIGQENQMNCQKAISRKSLEEVYAHHNDFIDYCSLPAVYRIQMKPDVGILAFILMRIEWAELPNTRRFA